MKTVPKNILIHLPAHIKSNRDLLSGLLKYSWKSSRWDCTIVGISENYEHARIERQGFDGAVCYHDGTALAKRIMSLPIPVVAISADPVPPPPGRRKPFARIVCDSRSVGEGAARYIARLGCASIAYASQLPAPQWSRLRRRAFVQQLSAAGKSAELIGFRIDRPLESVAARIGALPAPVAIFAENDQTARTLVSICRNHGIAIPEDAMILGVDNDELLCETVTPSISSVRMNAAECGFLAGKMLDKMMASRVSPPSIAYSFAGIIERMSTARQSSADIIPKLVRDAVRAALAGEGAPAAVINVKKICRSLRCSRRTAEMAFRKATGFTIHEEIVRSKLGKAMKLISNPELSIESIASLCAFSSPSHMGALFRRRFGITPGQMRIRNAAGRTSREVTGR